MRDQLAHAEAARLAGATKGDYAKWHDEMKKLLTPYGVTR